MSSHRSHYIEFANKYSQIKLRNIKYLGFRDVPALLQKHVRGNKALDFGCGQGKSTTFLNKLGFVVDGVDINEHMIDLARKTLPENNFRVIKDGNIPAKNEQYDLVFASWGVSLHWSKGFTFRSTIRNYTSIEERWHLNCNCVQRSPSTAEIENDYRDGLRLAGLDVVLIHEPLGRDDDEFTWINKKKVAPYPIYVAKKSFKSV
ncbi:hypothetical protein ACFE04_008350 [Oxalis oulophora]